MPERADTDGFTGATGMTRFATDATPSTPGVRMLVVTIDGICILVKALGPSGDFYSLTYVS
jgi:hypothetical protein